MRTAILIPSLGRADRVERVHGNIEQNTPEEHTQFWMVTEEEGYAEKLFLLMPTNLTYHLDDDDPDKRYVTRMNKLASLVRDLSDLGPDYAYDYVFFGSDDVVHHPRWLKNAIDVMESTEGCSVVVVNDWHNANGTQALVRTSYLPLAVYDDPSVAFHPGYRHNFADTEMFLTAELRGAKAYASGAVVEHLHPVFQSANAIAWDDTYLNAGKGWHEDARLFEARSAAIREALG